MQKIFGYMIPCRMRHKVIEKFISYIQEIKLPTNTIVVMLVFNFNWQLL